MSLSDWAVTLILFLMVEKWFLIIILILIAFFLFRKWRKRNKNLYNLIDKRLDKDRNIYK